MEILSLTTTVATREDAERLARALIDQRLSACVQLDSAVQSHYSWEGQAREDAEVRLTVKSLPELLPRLLAFFGEHHPYDVPQLLWQVMQAGPAYGRWVKSKVDAG